MKNMPQQLAHDLNEKPRTADVYDDCGISFETLLLSEPVQNGLTKNGFQKPSPIQLKAIPIGRCGFDLIVKSKSGTGKTLVFAVIALEMIKTSKNSLQVLILTPTREIAVQAADFIKLIGCDIHGLKVETFIGGLPLQEDEKKIKHCHIAVGAPGRIKHLLDKGLLSTDALRLFILDEADKLMDASLQSDINQIYHHLDARKQMIALSATYPDELDLFLAKYMQTPTHVSQDSNTPILLGLKQFAAVTKPCTNPVQAMKIKNEQLLFLLSRVPFTQCLVFTNYQTRAESVSNIINQKNWDSEFISAAQPQKKRLDVMQRFKDYKFRVLLSTDLTARGIDASSVDLVINYDIPNCAATYLHRMGRAGRYGSQGLCINIVSTNKDLKDLQVILGVIGGLKLSIAKLPLNDDFNYDLWNCDYDTFEQIHATTGTVAEKDEMNKDIKDSVFDLKTDRCKQKRTLKAKTEKTDDNVDIISKKIENVSTAEKETTEEKYEVEEQNEQLLENDTLDILQALAAGKNVCIDEVNIKKQQPANEEIKGKRENISTHVERSTTNEIFDKNMALLSVSKLLLNPSESISKDIVNPIENYLHKSKLLENELCQKNVNEECQQFHTNSEEFIKNDNSSNDYLENIFKRGFEYACKPGARDWRSFVPKNVYEQFKLDDVKKSDSESDENDLEMVEFEEENEDIEMNAEEENMMHDNGHEYKETIAVDGYNNATCDPYSEPPFSEHYAECYRHCSSTLSDAASTFKDVKSFDDWYSNWMDQLYRVRNYVQQNIYVQEMSKYQQNK